MTKHHSSSNERTSAIALANRVLDRPYGDPNDDLAVLSRQLLRRHEEIERLRAALNKAELSYYRAQWMGPRAVPPVPVPETLPDAQLPGQDFDIDLARLDSVRFTLNDMKRSGLRGGLPQDEAFFLLSFIDKLWREYSRESAKNGGANADGT